MNLTINTINKWLTVAVLMFVALPALAGPYTGAKNVVCPEEWSDTKEPIPVITPDLEPWSENASDKGNTKNHIASRDPIVTLDALPVTNDDLVDDLLTVASECLVYRNFEVDTADYVAPTSDPNYDNGWMPASIF